MFCVPERWLLRYVGIPEAVGVAFDVIDHLFVVVFQCGPHGRSLAIFCCMYCVGMHWGAVCRGP